MSVDQSWHDPDMDTRPPPWVHLEHTEQYCTTGYTGALAASRESKVSWGSIVDLQLIETEVDLRILMLTGL